MQSLRAQFGLWNVLAGEFESCPRYFRGLANSMLWNFGKGVCWQDLKDHMRGPGGQVEYVKIIQDYDGRSKVGLTGSPSALEATLTSQSSPCDSTGVWCL